MGICTRCGTENVDGVEHCIECGASLAPEDAGKEQPGSPAEKGAALAPLDAMEGIVPLARQRTGEILAGICVLAIAVSCMVLPWISGPLGTAYAYDMLSGDIYIGLEGTFTCFRPYLFLIIMLIMAFLTPKYMAPSRKRISGREWREKKKSIPYKVIYRLKSLKGRIIGMAALFLVISGLGVANLISFSGVERASAGIGIYIITGGGVLGAASVLMMWPSAANKIAKMDDEGRIYT